MQEDLERSAAAHRLPLYGPGFWTVVNLYVSFYGWEHGL